LKQEWKTMKDKRIYHHLRAIAKSPKTDIWVSDEGGNLVQKEIGKMTTFLIPGTYFVEFGLGNPKTRIDLSQKVTINE